jgi:hypothetical protein
MSNPSWDNVSLLMHMNGANGSTTFIDEKGKTVTAHGNAQIGTATWFPGGTAAYLDGDGDYLSVGTSNDFNFGSGAFTVEGRFRLSSIGSVASTLLYRGSSSGFGASFWLPVLSNGSINIFLSTGGISWDIGGGSSPGLVQTNTLYDVSVVRSGNTLLLFLDGTLVFSTAFTGSIISSTSNLLIGAYNGPLYSTHGYMGEWRVTKGEALYTASYTPTPGALPNNSVIDINLFGRLAPTGVMQVFNPQIITAALSGRLSPAGQMEVFNPSINEIALSGALLPNGYLSVDNAWEITGELSGRLKPTGYLSVDNADPNIELGLSIHGVITPFSRFINGLGVAGLISIRGDVSVATELRLEVAGKINLINGSAIYEDQPAIRAETGEIEFVESPLGSY